MPHFLTQQIYPTIKQFPTSVGPTEAVGRGQPMLSAYCLLIPATAAATYFSILNKHNDEPPARPKSFGQGASSYLDLNLNLNLNLLLSSE